MNGDDQCCWWGGRTIKTTRKRWDMWYMAQHSHYYRLAPDKIHALIMLFFLVDHPKWSYRTAKIAKNHMRMSHEHR